MSPDKLYYTPEERAHDPREHQEWFLRLPEHGKQEMRRLWRASEGHTGAQVERRARTTNRYLIEGVAFFVLLFWLCYPFHAQGLLLAVVVGLAVGAGNAYLRSGAYKYGWVCLFGQAAFTILYMGGIAFIPLIFATCGGTVVGVGHTLNRYDFTET